MARRRRDFGGSRSGARIGEAEFHHRDTENCEKDLRMLTPEKAGDVFERIRKLCSADEVEVLFSGGRFALTRFANNTIHQNVAEENAIVSVRTVFDGKTARATTNKFDDASLRSVVRASESLAKVQQRDPDLLPMPDAREADGSADKSETGETTVSTQSPSRYFDRSAAITPETRADGVKKIVKLAEQHKLTSAGVFSTGESSEGIFNSRGLSRWHKQTSAEISVTMLAEDSSGWQKANSPDVANLDPLTLAETAAKKAIESAHPREVPAGKYIVILEPAAVLDIVGFMFWDYSGMAVLDQRSFLTGRIGTKLFGEKITIWDDVEHPSQSGSPFDGEGVRRRKVELVERGIVKRLVYARSTAQRMKRSEYKDNVGPIAATGHGFPLPNEVGEMPLNIVFAAPRDPQSLEQMIASTDRGILVTRLWYIREVDPYEKIVTGMTRDGTFYVENGRVQYGVRNFRFNESLISMLSKVEAMSVPVRASGEESFDMVVPAMKVREFNFTEVTKF